VLLGNRIVLPGTSLRVKCPRIAVPRRRLASSYDVILNPRRIILLHVASRDQLDDFAIRTYTIVRKRRVINKSLSVV